MKRVLVSRDVIIDESTEVFQNKPTNSPAQKTRIQWEPESSIPKYNENVSTERQDEYLRLDPVTPPPEREGPIGPGSADMDESIVLRPQLARAQNREESREAVQGERTPTDQGTRRLRRNRGAGENFHNPANFALMAKVAETEPETLTEALNSEAMVLWKRA